jgi:hypothetical protein
MAGSSYRDFMALKMLWPPNWPTTPPEVVTEPEDVPTTLQELTDYQLTGAQLALGLMCGRSKRPLQSKHRAIICTVLGMLNAEAHRRAGS